MWNYLGSEIYADTSSHCWLSRFTTRRTHVGCRVGLKCSPILCPFKDANFARKTVIHRISLVVKLDYAKDQSK